MRNWNWVSIVSVVAVILVALVAAVVSYEHLHRVAIAAGETGWIAAIVPLSADGLLVSASLSAFLAKRRNENIRGMTIASLAVGLAASVAANVASPFVGDLTGTSQAVLAAIVSAWPAVALALAFEESLRMTQSNKAIPAVQESRRGDEIPSEGKDTGEEFQALRNEVTAEASVTPEVPAQPEVSTVPEQIPTATSEVPAASGKVAVATVPTVRKSGNAGSGSSVKAEALAHLDRNPETTAIELAEMFDRSDRWARGIRSEFQKSGKTLQLVTA